MKIDQYLMKLCIKYYWFTFFGHGVVLSVYSPDRYPFNDAFIFKALILLGKYIYN